MDAVGGLDIFGTVCHMHFTWFHTKESDITVMRGYGYDLLFPRDGPEVDNTLYTWTLRRWASLGSMYFFEII